MTIQKLREAQRAAPFRPFKIHTADALLVTEIEFEPSEPASA
jgi:hypothetical protein